jgi:phosphoglycolate phosphatase
VLCGHGLEFVKKYKYILFDLDGTITDPGLGIINSVIYALEKFGITVVDRNDLKKFIGPPLWDSFERYYRLSKKEAERAVLYYREYYSEKGIFENYVYEGIADLLKDMKINNKVLIVATSKPEIYAKQILVCFDLAKYFYFVAGGTLDGTRVKKDDVISYALGVCHIDHLDKVLMIGDREHDIFGAKNVGIDSMGVLFGYGDRDELEKAGATYIAETVSSIRKIIR